MDYIIVWRLWQKANCQAERCVMTKTEKNEFDLSHFFLLTADRATSENLDREELAGP